MQLLVAGLAAFFLLRYAKAGIDLSMEFQGVRLKGLRGLNPVLEFDLRFVNPKNAEFTVQDLFLDVETNGARIGEILQPEWNKTIPARSVSTHSVEFVIDTLRVGALALEIYKTRKLPRKFRTHGNIRAEGILLPIDITYDTTTMTGTQQRITANQNTQAR